MIDLMWRGAEEEPQYPEQLDGGPLWPSAASSALATPSLASTASSWSHQVHTYRSTRSKVSDMRDVRREASSHSSAISGRTMSSCPMSRCPSTSSSNPALSAIRAPPNPIYQPPTGCRCLGSSLISSAGAANNCRRLMNRQARRKQSVASPTTRISSTYTIDKMAAQVEEEYVVDYSEDENGEETVAMSALLSVNGDGHSSRRKSRRRRPLRSAANRKPPITCLWPGNSSAKGGNSSSSTSSSVALFATIGLLLLLSNCLDLLPPMAAVGKLGQAQAAVNLTPASGKSITMSATVGGVSGNSNNNNNYYGSSSNNNNNNNNPNSHHNVYTRDEESEQQPATQLPPTVDEPSIFNENENFTQIPLEPQGGSSRGGIINNKRLAFAATTTTTSTRRPSSSSSSKRPVVQVTETELLPFSDFNVHQPAFSDLIRSYPPTGQQQAAQSRRRRPAASQQYPNSNQQHHHLLHHQLAAGYQPQWSSAGVANEGLASDADDDSSAYIRNHLNEDLDDTAATADESFERDQLAEPPTWINYLGDLGDHIFVQLRQFYEKSLARPPLEPNEPEAQQQQQTDQLPIEMIDEILDDYYYDQYENTQVLYYGAQLVREGDIFEIGCYLPSDHEAEWTKSGRLLSATTGASPRVVRRTDFLGAKQNYSLKVFEASLADSGNYRCDQMSRKYHKLVVVPRKTGTTQLYLIQQRLLSVVNPHLMSAGELGLPVGRLNLGHYMQRLHAVTTSAASSSSSSSSTSVRPIAFNQSTTSRDQLLPGYLIVEQHPLVVSCNISDEFVLRRLRDTPHFQLAWFKNGKLLRGYAAGSTTAASNPAARTRAQQSISPAAHLVRPASPRIQFLGANGRQLYISSAQYTDAGEYLCSWSKLPKRQQQANNEESYSSAGAAAESDSGHQASGATISNNLLAAGRLVQLTVPVKLRPFRSTYHVRQGNELRILCQAARGYPAPLISWYVGNRLVDSEFLREHGRDFRLMHLQNQNQVVVTSDPSWSSSSSSSPSSAEISGSADAERQIVEINPIPASRQQMQLTVDGRGQWVEYRDAKNDKYSIETPEQQLRYMKQKLAQLTGANSQSTNRLAVPGTATVADLSGSSGDPTLALLGQASLSMLVIKSLDIERHTSRYACRATSRANTDEVTTVIQVEASKVRAIKPSTGKATLIPGQDLNFQCGSDERANFQYIWYKRNLKTGEEERLEPNDDIVEIHNERLTLHKPSVSFAGDYICRANKDEFDAAVNESATIQVRTLPYIEDFGLDTSHTGKSGIITDGERLELTCTISDTSQPVNITWLRSMTPDEEHTMVPLPDTPKSALPSAQSFTTADPFAQTFMAPDQSIIVESLSNHSKRLVIESVSQEHRSYYVCMADNGITDRTRKIIFIRVKDKLVALWPFLGIVAELIILFTIIHIWETQRAYKQIHATTPSATASPTGSKRPASGASVAFESVPLTRA